MRNVLQTVALTCLLTTSCTQRFSEADTAFDTLGVFLLAYGSVCAASPDQMANTSAWPGVQAVLKYENAKGSLVAPSVSVFGNVGAGTSKWSGGVLAPNGKIYGIPRSAGTVLEIDPGSRSLLQFGSVAGSEMYTGGVLAQNGKIYAIPYAATTVLEIDPNTRATVQFGSLPATIGKWEGGVLASNGKIYAMPSNVASYLEIDPVNRTANQIAAPAGGGYYAIGAVPGPNGKVYGIPYAAGAQVMEYDPQSRLSALFGPAFAAASFSGGVFSPGGLIYTVPYTNAAIYEIDPARRSATAVTSSFAGYVNGVLAPNGKIYMLPFDSGNQNVLEFDPVTKATNTYGNNFGGAVANKYEGGVLAMNGRIYTIPRDATNVAEIDTGSTGTYCSGLLLSPYLNHY